MKVKISFTLDVNADAWADEFHIDKSDVRADVQRAVETQAVDYVALLGCQVSA